MNTRIQTMLVKDGSDWVAFDGQYDLNGQGSTIWEACRSLLRTFSCQVMLDLKEGLEPLSGTRPLPESYREKSGRCGLLIADPAVLDRNAPPLFFGDSHAVGLFEVRVFTGEAFGDQNRTLEV